MIDQLWHRVWLSLPEDAGVLLDEGATVVVQDRGVAVLTIDQRHCEECPRTEVALAGDIDHHTAPFVAFALWRALSGHRPVRCDLRDVTYFGSAAARTIVEAQSLAALLGRDFELRGVHGLAAQVLDILDPERLIRR
ncbi:STAS domain-containing protein [Paractinoplanes rishiriensis]|uniref:STAS domain-containing protein n=1 Tax=Paractinoplanes rishiriensis TaxID=1050105 RepID=A0A919K2L6_9ACTN|nr:STAS domain-containing protein [Actinoplanes rishiriensis]GIE97488.1 hypothetical protein Ari01nite_49530 [Actinoplanes rishiriensis]